MDELDSLDYYNGEPMHDMEVDYDYHIMHRGIYGWVLIFLETRIRIGASPDCRGNGWVRIFLAAPVRRFTELCFLFLGGMGLGVVEVGYFAFEEGGGEGVTGLDDGD